MATVNAGSTVSNAQTARDDSANPSLPVPLAPAVTGTTNAVPIPVQSARDDAAPTVKKITQTQATDQTVEQGRLVRPPESGTISATVASSETVVAAAGNDDSRQSDSVEQTNQVRTRLDELYSNKINAKGNILDKFASYTYSLSWYLMEPTAYQRLINQKKKDLNGYYLLVQSGGVGEATGRTIRDYQQLPAEQQNIQATPGSAGRSPFFPLDYYIDDLDAEILYAAGSESQSAAAFTNIKFTLTEPNGLTLLPNLYRACEDLIKNGGQTFVPNDRINYAAAMFCMVIRFYGYDENGVLQLPAVNDQGNTDSRAVIEKFIPFTLKKIDFSVGSKLVEYTIEGAPPDINTALSTNRGSVPQDYGFSGITVRDILVGDISQTNLTAQESDSARSAAGAETPAPAAAVSAARNSRDAQRQQQERRLGQTTAPAKADAAPKPTTSTVGTGLMAALNNYQLERVKKGKAEHPDTYNIVFADEILESATVAPPGGLNKNNVGGTATATAADQKLPETNAIKPTVRLRRVRAGTQIVQFIDDVMRNSSYIINQQSVIYDEKTKQYKQNGKPARQFAWFQITATAEPGLYDKIRNDYAYKITYYVTPYEVPMVSEYFNPSGFRGVHKIYNYWFTGENTQVIQFEQSFDKLWTQVLTADTNIQQLSQQQRRQMNSREQWMRHSYAASGQSYQGGEGKVFEGGANAADFLYGPNYGRIQLNIIGDPDWIPTAQNWYSTQSFTTQPFWPDGTINNSASIPYFEFAWNRPVDYNLNNGLMDPGQKNYFADREKGEAGLAAEAQTYVATRLKNMFKGGRFTQELEGAWMWDQTINEPNNQRENTPAIDPRADIRAGRGFNRAELQGRSEILQSPTGGSAVAQGVQQILSPVTQSVNPTLTQLQSSQAFITARRAGVPPREALEIARQAFTAGTAGQPYQTQPIVREP
jgi:hypothetical protein